MADDVAVNGKLVEHFRRFQRFLSHERHFESHFLGACARWIVIALLLCVICQRADAQGTFIARQGQSFSNQGDYWVQQFEVTGAPKEFAFYFASDYQATAAIFTPANLSSFQNGNSFSALALFDRQTGSSFPTLSPGIYYIGVRNATNGVNRFSLELDDFSEYPPVEGATFNTTVLADSRTVSANGGKSWVGFRIYNDFMYTVDGCNSGLETFLIPASELTNFTSGNTFSYYSGYSGTDAALPGYSVLNLPAGDYYYVFRNNTSETKTSVIRILAWDDPEVGGGGGGLDLVAPVSWSVSSGQMTMSAAAVVNSRNATSGSLRLDVWFTASPFTSGTLSGYPAGSYDFTSVLPPNNQFTNISRTVEFLDPPDGIYYTVMTLSEWNGSEFVIQDFENFSGTTQIGGGGAVPVPSAITASDGTSENNVFVDWTGVGSGHTYNTYRGTSSSFASSQRINSFSSLDYFYDVSAVAGITYYYWVTAVRTSDGAESAPNGPNTGYKAVPSGGGAVPVPSWIAASDGTSSSYVTLTWNGLGNAYRYNIFRSIGSSFGGAQKIANLRTEDYYFDYSASPGTVYRYWVTAVRTSDAAESGASGSDTGYATTSTGSNQFDPNILSITGLSASQGIHPTTIFLSFNAQGYPYFSRIYRSTTNSFATASLIEDNWYLDEFDDTEAPVGVPVYYWIVNVRSTDNNFGSPSVPVTGYAGQLVAVGNFEGWITDSAVAVDKRGRLDDPDGDGRVNLAEMALGRSASASDPASDITTTIAGNQVTLSFAVSSTYMGDFDYLLEMAGSGITGWVSAGLTPVQGATSNGRTSFSVITTKSAGARIFRLKITEK